VLHDVNSNSKISSQRKRAALRMTVEMIMVC